MRSHLGFPIFLVGAAAIGAGLSLGGVLGWTLFGIGTTSFFGALVVYRLRVASKNTHPADSEEYNPYDPYDIHNPYGLAQRNRGKDPDMLDKDLDDLLKLDH
jgi:hypothetical protein